MKVLGLTSYPVEAAATRYRLSQFIEPLAEKGITLEVSPFLNNEQFRLFYKNKSLFENTLRLVKPILRRFSQIPRIRKYDLIFVQREAMFFGPAFFEWIYHHSDIPMILDLDDATYLPYVSPTYGKIGSFFKFFGKTDNLIKSADVVICGNRFIAEYVSEKGTEAVIVPTVVDTEKFKPIEKNNEIPVVGWIGTHSTFPLLQSIFPVLQDLAKKHRFTLKIVGAGSNKIEIDGVNIENLQWNLERETEDFQSLDIGLYPITTAKSLSPEWIMKKSGFKAIQYLAVGIPFVVSPIGICAEIGEVNITHFTAMSMKDWYDSLDKLLSDCELRRRMGIAGRKHSLKHYTLPQQTEIIAQTFHNVYRKL